MHANAHTHTDKICLSRPISGASTWLGHLCVRSCMTELVQWIFAQFTLCNCVWMCLCLCVRLCWLIPWSGETRPDGAWRLAVFVVTELMMSFMKFIDPICMAPRVPSPISLSVFLTLPLLSIYVHVHAPNATLHSQHTRTHSQSWVFSFCLPSHTCVLPVHEHYQTPQPSNCPGKNLQAVTSHTLGSNLMELSFPAHSTSMLLYAIFLIFHPAPTRLENPPPQPSSYFHMGPECQMLRLFSPPLSSWIETSFGTVLPRKCYKHWCVFWLRLAAQVKKSELLLLISSEAHGRWTWIDCDNQQLQEERRDEGN